MISNVDPRAFDYGMNVVHSVCCLIARGEIAPYHNVLQAPIPFFGSRCRRAHHPFFGLPREARTSTSPFRELRFVGQQYSNKKEATHADPRAERRGVPSPRPKKSRASP